MGVNYLSGTARPKEQALIDLARAQLGVFTRAQAMSLGWSARSITLRLSLGDWRRVYEGVYRLRVVAATFEQGLLAAQLSAGPGSVASHRAAAKLLRLDGIEISPVELTTARPGCTREGFILHHTTKLPSFDVARLGPLLVTTGTRTLLDLPAVCPPDVVEYALDDALRRGLTTLSRLGRRLTQEGRGRRRIAVLRKLVEARLSGDPIVESLFEAKLFKLLADSGVPLPMKQFEIRDGLSFVARVDFAYPREKLIIEADSLRFHSGNFFFQEGIDRGNKLVGLGWRVIRVSWEDLIRRPRKVLNAIRKALEANS